MKRDKIIFWITTGFIALFEGAMPLGTLLFKPEYVTLGTKPLGYPDYFAFALVIFKVLGVLALLLTKLPPKIREWAYAGFAFNLIFAVISHVVVDQNISYIVTPIVIGAVLAASYIYNQKVNASC
ncbi:MAG: hypothetical protein K0R51_2460 [Cytophagaceae bacterium]|jgi:hypothetical protein|nr:hypothetical protein [Cytophagaceae bacterium]